MDGAGSVLGPRLRAALPPRLEELPAMAVPLGEQRQLRAGRGAEVRPDLRLRVPLQGAAVRAPDAPVAVPAADAEARDPPVRARLHPALHARAPGAPGGAGHAGGLRHGGHAPLRPGPLPVLPACGLRDPEGREHVEPRVRVAGGALALLGHGGARRVRHGAAAAGRRDLGVRRPLEDADADVDRRLRRRLGRGGLRVGDQRREAPRREPVPGGGPRRLRRSAGGAGAVPQGDTAGHVAVARLPAPVRVRHDADQEAVGASAARRLVPDAPRGRGAGSALPSAAGRAAAAAGHAVSCHSHLLLARVAQPARRRRQCTHGRLPAWWL